MRARHTHNPTTRGRGPTPVHHLSGRRSVTIWHLVHSSLPLLPFLFYISSSIGCSNSSSNNNNNLIFKTGGWTTYRLQEVCAKIWGNKKEQQGGWDNVKSTRKKRATVVCWLCRRRMRTSVTTKARKVVGEVEDREIGFFNVSGKKPDLALLTLSFIELQVQ